MQDVLYSSSSRASHSSAVLVEIQNQKGWAWSIGLSEKGKKHHAEKMCGRGESDMQQLVESNTLICVEECIRYIDIICCI
jgi:hypothetical protein